MILAPDGQPARRQIERRAPRQMAYQSNGWSGIYEAAMRNDYRGWFYIPSLSPAEQLNNLSLQAIRERTDWLYANVGATRMLIDRVALGESGSGLWPRWTTGDEAFDQEATDAYHFACHDPRFFSVDGKTDAYSVQYNIRRLIAKGGDCFGQLVRPGDAGGFPKHSLLPGYQCDNPSRPESGTVWRDGIRYTVAGAPLEYCFHTTDDQGRRTEQIVPADDVLHYTDPLLPEQRRGEPALACVARKMFRREDLYHAIANGTLARERLGFAIESDETGDDGGPSATDLPGDGDVTTTTGPDGQTLTVKRLFGERIADEIEIPELPPGKKIRTVESNRPGTAVMEFTDSILREAAWARKYPVEYVFFLAGISQGTVARGVDNAAAEVITASREFQLRPQFGIRWPVFFVWQLIRGGYFARRKIAVPDKWWKTKIIFPERPTMDVGRVGGLLDNRVATGKLSIEKYHGDQGEDAADVERENVAAIARRMKLLGQLNRDTASERDAAGMPAFRYEDVWSRNVNIQPPQPIPTPQP